MFIQTNEQKRVATSVRLGTLEKAPFNSCQQDQVQGIASILPMFSSLGGGDAWCLGPRYPLSIIDAGSAFTASICTESSHTDSTNGNRSNHLSYHDGISGRTTTKNTQGSQYENKLGWEHDERAGTLHFQWKQQSSPSYQYMQTIFDAGPGYNLIGKQLAKVVRAALLLTKNCNTSSDRTKSSTAWMDTATQSLICVTSTTSVMNTMPGGSFNHSTTFPPLYLLSPSLTFATRDLSNPHEHNT
eukprot:1157712-Pelagomonas_calceolata.AAC.7